MSIGMLHWGKIPGRGVLSSKLPTYTPLGLNHLLVCLPPGTSEAGLLSFISVSPGRLYCLGWGGAGKCSRNDVFDLVNEGHPGAAVG